MRRAVALGGCVLAASLSLLAGPVDAQQGGQGQISVSPPSASFSPPRCVNTTSSPQSFTIRNTASGGGPESNLTITSITRSGDGDFAFTNVDTTLAPDQWTHFTVTFTPKARGSRSATLTIHSDDPDQPELPVQVSGTGIDRRLVPDRGTVSFGPQQVGTRSPSQQLLVRNNGGDPVTVTAVSRRGSNAKDFVVTTPAPPFTIPPGDVRTLSIAFQPTAAGERRAGLQFDSNACSKPTVIVALVGAGADPNLVVTPNPISAGASPQGVKSAAVPVTLSNDGGASLRVTAIQIVGPDADDFELAGLPVVPTTVLAGASFVFNVFMTPAELGLRTATLKVLSDDPDAPALEVPLSGTGGTASPSPTSSPGRSSSPSARPSTTVKSTPQAFSGKPPNDSLAVALVIGGVIVAFGGLMVLRRRIAQPDEG
jgi:ASPM-SPD-2-Hydin domain-containing protein/HYDIN/CFA65/VesB family protein